MTILGFTICYSENSGDIGDLLNMLLEAGINLNEKDITIMSDRGKAIVKAVRDILPHALHTHCPVHLIRNLKSYFRDSCSGEALLGGSQRSDSCQIL